MIRFTVSSAAYAIRLSGEGGVPLWSPSGCAEASLIAAAISSLTSSTVTPLFCATNSSARSAAAMSNFISSFPFSGCGLIRTSTVLVSTILTPRKRKYCRNKGREKEQTVNKTKIDCSVMALRHALQRCAPHTAEIYSPMRPSTSRITPPRISSSAVVELQPSGAMPTAKCRMTIMSA